MIYSDLVSVIVPCYNQAQYLPDALESVLAQTYNDWECIIVNDGSPDNTEEVALEWCKKDKRFKYLKKENGGLSSARNAGLKSACGDFLQFLDADDVIDKNKFQIQVAQLLKAPKYGLSYCDYFASAENLVDPCLSRYKTPRFKSNNYLHELIANWEVKLSIPCHCFLFKRNIFEENDIVFDESLPNHEDWECWMNIFSLQPEVYFIDQKLVTYRIQTKSLCHDSGLMKKGYLLAVNKQKQILKNNAEAYKLLCIKCNWIKFGVSHPNTYNSFLIYCYRKLKNQISIWMPKFVKNILKKILMNQPRGKPRNALD